MIGCKGKLERKTYNLSTHPTDTNVAHLKLNMSSFEIEFVRSFDYLSFGLSYIFRGEKERKKGLTFPYTFPENCLSL